MSVYACAYIHSAGVAAGVGVGVGQRAVGVGCGELSVVFKNDRVSHRFYERLRYFFFQAVCRVGGAVCGCECT